MTPQSSTAITATPRYCEKATQLGLETVEAAYLHGGIMGVCNLGNSCYMNATIQCLSHTLEMTDIFLSRDFPLGTICSGWLEQ